MSLSSIKEDMARYEEVVKQRKRGAYRTVRVSIWLLVKKSTREFALDVCGGDESDGETDLAEAERLNDGAGWHSGRLTLVCIVTSAPARSYPVLP
jgi:hypothetical protein